MHTGSDSMLYLKATGADDLLSQAIRSRGWKVHVTGDPCQARNLIGEQGLRVGLVQLDADDERSLQRQAEQLLSLDRQMTWVALLPKTASIAPAVCRMIFEYFYDYHSLPPDVDRLVVTLGHARGMAGIADRLRCSNADRGQVDLAGSLGMVGQAPCVRELFQQVHKVAEPDLNVLIRGESGTGKELVAQAIHRLSGRSAHPFVAVNCGALPKELIQAELFGHEKGSFTGADRRREGQIEAARNGTLFLDEIGDLPLDMQVNLLRFLQEKTIQRIGGSTPITVDVRVIAATHVNLEKAVAKGQFREDLYYRLNVLHLEVPPLRERPGDVELLAKHYFEQFSSSIRPQLKGFSRQAIDAMNAYAWPGNVRELVNRVQRAVVMCEGRLIKPRDLAMDREGPDSPLLTLAGARAQAEKQVIEATLGAVRNNVSSAARHLDVSRVTLYRLMEQYGIDWQRSRNA